ncbi:TolC family outer membrane protein [Bartonella sp. TP]|uniref:TolC family outer membrane protein n=1 Tax=Bartonella sp. TP TaxID=3057550 RepID=UPI0025AFBC80|nr:TolC family outer membrane protein [Bartonella sp. TP]MDN5249453.1 TolC family outer membrane protein [Alphaproteobacteria bacterium]WJW79798.1 TolC family outer membrane protein [Bartonella sp. TP]
MRNSIRIIALLLSVLYANFACAETLLGAMTKAYNNNVSLNSSRYAARASDEDVAVAMSAVRPVINVTGSYSSQWLNADSHKYSDTGALQIQISQRLFDGFQAANNIKAARAQAAAQRQALRNEEQNQLNNTVAAYANVFASREIVKLRHQNLLALEEQVRSANARLVVGEGTKTDYAQAKAAYSRALSEYSEALASTTQAEAVYRQVVGVEPDSLDRPMACSALPKSLDDAYAIAITNHPAILSAQEALNASKFIVAAKEGALLPEVGFGFSRNYSKLYSNHGVLGGSINAGPSTSVGLQLSLPLYHGGANFAFIRKAKEQSAQAHLQLDLYRNNVRAALLSSWAKLKSSRASVKAYLSSVKAANIALDGRISENKVGQATLLDVLNTRSQLITMQVALVNARRNLVIASYNVKAAIGHMTAPFLKLNVDLYDPLLHYHQTEYRFIGNNVSPLD